MDTPVSVYIHIPFCKHRCGYCDFNTYAGKDELIPSYVASLCTEIELTAGLFSQPVQVETIFFGGGTPSYLPVPHLVRILQTCRGVFQVSPTAEITVEANPGTVSRPALFELRSAGINRLSLGVQSAHPDDLRLLERQHDSYDVFRAVAWSREAGFDNLNLDLLLGLPDQTVRRWQGSLEMAVGLKPEHLSIYALSVEPGTPFRRWVERGLVAMPADDLAADMYDLAYESLRTAGYRHYEISNWAGQLTGRDLACRHNLQYWRSLPYLGFGAGAHGFIAGHRTANVRGIRTYIQRLDRPGPAAFPGSPAAEEVIHIDRWTEMQEVMMVGLRLVEEGVSVTGFERRFGVALAKIFSRQIDKLTRLGLVEWAQHLSQPVLRLTRPGWLLGNQVFSEFVGLRPPKDPNLADQTTTTLVP